MFLSGETKDGEPQRSAHFILLEFRDPEESEDPRPVSYVVRGAQRDWVFVTASELDERIAKIKCFSPLPFLSSRHPFPLVTTFAFTLALSLLVAISFVTPKTPPLAAQAIESHWKAGTLRDPIQAIIIQAQYIESSRKLFNPRVIFLSVIVAAALLAILVVLIVQTAISLFPAYVFSWGDNIKLYERRVQFRRYVLGGVLLTLVLGIIASVIGNKLTLGR